MVGRARLVFGANLESFQDLYERSLIFFCRFKARSRFTSCDFDEAGGEQGCIERLDLIQADAWCIGAA
jgi:hypothetical protein